MTLFPPAIVEKYHVRFRGFADIEVLSIGSIEAVSAARHVLMAERGVTNRATLESGHVTFVEAA
ncbi:hypothetical protein [Synechococcus sp. MIT S9504]|uniref:hypothetical protein n=1 Tax=Synechococcus sp. MIT S9504 TaxID=1801628 RepID=UPI0007BAF5BF|nr:hypothetical protein [Synechococcus sp. MIT S9504]KZR87700.1 hypothetical protein MITS9504_00122 [Synechococcus sp. MIT S9504]